MINWFHAEETVACLRAYRRWAEPLPPVYVVCNGDTPDGRKLLSEQLGSFCEVTFLDENLGFGEANNIGLEKAFNGGALHVVLANADARMDEVSFAALFDAFDEATSDSVSPVGAVSPVIVENHGGHEVRFCGSLDISCRRNTRVRCPDKKPAAADSRYSEREFLMGTFLVISKEAWHKTGPLEPAYFFSGEVSDWCIRARKCGFRLLVDHDVEAIHDTAVAGENVRSRHHLYYSLRNRFRFIARHHPKKRIYLYPFWIGVGFLEGAKSLVRLKPEQAVTIASAIWHGLTGKTGPRMTGR